VADELVAAAQAMLRVRTRRPPRRSRSFQRGSPRKPHLKPASTFTTLAEAERCTYANLGAHQAEIDAFLASNKDYATFRMDFDHPVGPTMVKQLSNAVDATSVFTLLRKDPGHANGYRMATSFAELG
jgi:hypothetical protein